MYLKNVLTGGHTYRMVPVSPIGCRGSFDVNNCTITWGLESSVGCTATQDPHSICGFSAQGVSYSVLQDYNYYYYGSIWKNAMQQQSYNYESNYTNGSYFYMETYFKNNINIPNNNTKYIARARFDYTEFSGHSVWNEYTLPDIVVSH